MIRAYEERIREAAAHSDARLWPEWLRDDYGRKTGIVKLLAIYSKRPATTIMQVRGTDYEAMRREIDRAWRKARLAGKVCEDCGRAPATREIPSVDRKVFLCARCAAPSGRTA